MTKIHPDPNLSQRFLKDDGKFHAWPGFQPCLRLGCLGLIWVVVSNILPRTEEDAAVFH